ncbi:hypothetical protein [uncultured Dysosmobacter sp.]|uniref:hypothetical protein n=1 Tax=uncultured Dysosmobacter sp. TaxID=2591384 RepID=UPI00260ACAFF|nr:hypothetical protein [uncultured Dysosmobacter sp.]
MSNTRMVSKFTDQAVAAAAQMKREDYKAVKHMSKIELTAYLGRIWRRGYEAGLKAGAKAANENAEKAPSEADGRQEG